METILDHKYRRYVPYGYIKIRAQEDIDTLNILSITTDIRTIYGYTIVDMYKTNGFNLLIQDNKGLILDRRINKISKKNLSLEISTIGSIYIGDEPLDYNSYTLKIKRNLKIYKHKARIKMLKDRADEIGAENWQKAIMIKNLLLGIDFKPEVETYSLSEALKLNIEKQWQLN